MNQNNNTINGQGIADRFTGHFTRTTPGTKAVLIGKPNAVTPSSVGGRQLDSQFWDDYLTSNILDGSNPRMKAEG
jgi:hypothetical protein